MKKHSLLKAILISFLAVVVLSWIIPTGSVSSGSFASNGTEPVGLINLFRLPVMTFQTFIQYTIVLLAIGGFYGVLNKTGVYDNLVRNAAKSWKGKEKLLLIIVTIVFALIASTTGLSMVLFATVPFIAAVLLIVGYDKLTVMLSTIGATLVGITASTIGFSGAGYIKNILSINMTDEIITKVILFVLLVGLFVFFVVKKAILKKGEGALAAANDKIPFYTGDFNNTRSSLPLVVVLVLLLLLCLVASYNWYYGWGIEVFNNLHSALESISIGSYPIVKNLISGISSIGYWGNYEISVALIIFGTIIAWLYNVKLADVFDGVKKGCKEILPVALYATIANVVFAVMLSGQGNMFTAIAYNLSKITETFSLPIVGLISLIGSLFYNDFYYLLTSASSVLVSYDAVYYPLIGVISTGIHGLAMMVLPTSVMLIIGLKYFNISYKEWFKNLWKYLLTAFVLLILVSVIVMILI